MICINCGRENADNSKFCSYCGHIFAGQAPQEPGDQGYAAADDMVNTVAGDVVDAVAGDAADEVVNAAANDTSYAMPHDDAASAGHTSDSTVSRQGTVHESRIPEPEKPFTPTRSEDAIYDSSRKYQRRILICAVVALASLVVLVVFFIARPDLKNKQQGNLAPQAQTTVEETKPAVQPAAEGTVSEEKPAVNAADTTAPAERPAADTATPEEKPAADGKDSVTQTEKQPATEATQADVEA